MGVGVGVVVSPFPAALLHLSNSHDRLFLLAGCGVPVRDAQPEF